MRNIIQSIADGFIEKKETIDYLIGLGFNLDETSRTDLTQQVSSPLTGKAIVFTGKMALVKMYFKYPEITQIDIGANLDPYAGEGCRPWHPKMM